ncbi:rod-binding protein [Edaphobacter flagellatus]|uniref:rod-binding protein n=1 Tax=Edaphobacter flagellatus TaxID=1933044 RepID=UPI0021B1A0F0|nr:rod-binding protein [Edaphobacter flagellatus]
MTVTLDGVNTNLPSVDTERRSKLADAAQQFEAMMLQELLKPMRSGEDDLSGEKNEDSSMDTIASFGTEAVAKAISKSGGLGIARQIIQQLSTREPSASGQEISK